MASQPPTYDPNYPQYPQGQQVVHVHHHHPQPVQQQPGKEMELETSAPEPESEPEPQEEEAGCCARYCAGVIRRCCHYALCYCFCNCIRERCPRLACMLVCCDIFCPRENERP